MASEVHELATTALTAHAFNGDRTQVAVCENTNEVKIYKRTSTGWMLTHTLSDHDKLVTSIDWAPKTNRLVTASQDRNAYVWNFGTDPLSPTTTTTTTTNEMTWHPTLVLLRLNRSATFVRWSPNEEKFAVASSARTIAICQFDQESNWWVAKHLKKPFRSTILCLDWHPNSVLISAGCADGKAVVLSAYIKGVDSKPEVSAWGDKLPFNTVCATMASPYGGWVHGVAFSPSGNLLAFASHDSSISIVYPSTPGSPPQSHFVIRGNTLPFVTLCFIDENTVVAGGHDCQPVLFTQASQNGWQLLTSLDDGKSGSAASSAKTSTTGRLNNDAFNHFKAADSRGLIHNQGASASELTASKVGLTTVHQNTVTSIRPYVYGATSVEQISSSGVDGRLVIWDVASGLAKGMARLKV